MPTVYECPSCGKKLKIPDDLLGKTVRCSDCAGTFLAERPRSAAPLQPPSLRGHDDDEFNERQSRRVPFRDSDGRMPHRGVLVMIFGIVSIVMIVFSGGACAGGTVHGSIVIGSVPCAAIGLVLGILSWIWGSKDLSFMRAGVMDPSGHGMTLAGYVCGIIGTVVNALTLVMSCVALVLALLFGAVFAGSWCCLLSAFVSMFSSMKPNRNFPRQSVLSAPLRKDQSRYRIDGGSVMRLVDYLPPRKR